MSTTQDEIVLTVMDDEAKPSFDEKTKSAKPASIAHQMLAEAVGTMFITLFGLNAVSAAVLANGAAGNFQVGVMFGLGVIWGIYTAAPISGGHLNPAITAAIGLLRRNTFPTWKVPVYWLAQYFGGWFGAVLNFAIWRAAIANYENFNGIDRGSAASDITFSLFGCVFPFPPGLGPNWPEDLVSSGQAVLVEAIGTAVLCFVAFMVLDERNSTLKRKEFAPVLIGLVIAADITVLSPLTGGAFNPARDGGPRVLAAMAGWGRRAFPGKGSGFWVYFVGPVLGAIIGGSVYDFGVSRAYKGKMF